LPQLSFIKPTGRVTLGNYIGALSHWKPAPGSVFAVADLHAITVAWAPDQLRESILEVAAVLVALDLHTDGGLVFLQSGVPTHAEMAWLLECMARMGELSRMTQFKAVGRGDSSVSVGFFAYPILMAADILLYDTEGVPVGEDQKQHVELTRDLAIRVNNQYGPIFTVPEPLIPDVGARIMSLKNPTAKMSKSQDDPYGTVLLLDDADAIRRKFLGAVTDSGREVYFDPVEKPGISNLLEIAAGLAGETREDWAERYRTAGYGAFKRAVAEVVVEKTHGVRARALDLLGDPGELMAVLKDGQERALVRSAPKVLALKRAIGFPLAE
jgi:tryptophanyl-tRNA synthetase